MCLPPPTRPPLAWFAWCGASAGHALAWCPGLHQQACLSGPACNTRLGGVAHCSHTRHTGLGGEAHCSHTRHTGLGEEAHCSHSRHTGLGGEAHCSHSRHTGLGGEAHCSHSATSSSSPGSAWPPHAHGLPGSNINCAPAMALIRSWSSTLLIKACVHRLRPNYRVEPGLPQGSGGREGLNPTTV